MDSWVRLIEGNYKEYVKERIVEIGFRKALRATGVQLHIPSVMVWCKTSIALVQLIHLASAETEPASDASAKVVGPRMLHSSSGYY